MMQLWIDAGNTRIKWQIFSQASLCHEGAVTHRGDFDWAAVQLYEACVGLTKERVDQIGLAAVLDQNSLLMLAQALRQAFGVPVRCAQVSRHLLGFTCSYDDISRFGVDRWLACIAAFRRYRCAVMVVSCGSAMTIDACDASGQHLGGYILPGLSMARDALLGGTQSVRFDPGYGKLDSVEYGRDTATAVNNGLLFQASATITFAWQRFQTQTPGQDPKLMLTGGDAASVAAVLEIKDFELSKDLVLDGLRQVLATTDVNTHSESSG